MEGDPEPGSAAPPDSKPNSPLAPGNETGDLKWRCTPYHGFSCRGKATRCEWVCAWHQILVRRVGAPQITLGPGLPCGMGHAARDEVGGFRMPCAAWGAASAGPYFPRPAGCPATPEAPHLPRLAVDHIVKVY